MPDNKSKRGPPDGERINIHEEYELRDWAKHFGVTKQQIIDCVNRVGVMTKDVKGCLGK
jgi:predicted DNA-binding protein YlxM (UPF0122 family)